MKEKQIELNWIEFLHSLRESWNWNVFISLMILCLFFHWFFFSSALLLLKSIRSIDWLSRTLSSFFVVVVVLKLNRSCFPCFYQLIVFIEFLFDYILSLSFIYSSYDWKLSFEFEFELNPLFHSFSLFFIHSDVWSTS